MTVWASNPLMTSPDRFETTWLEHRIATAIRHPEKNIRRQALGRTLVSAGMHGLANMLNVKGVH